MIHICFGLHDKTGHYSKFTGTAMLSLFENTNAKVTVHILHDNTLTQDNRDKFSYVAGQYNQLVNFYNVKELCAEKIAKLVELIPAVKTSTVTVGAFYRLLIPQLLPNDIDKCIYLDSDMVINLDISELWRIEPGDSPLAAVPEAVASSVAFKTYAYDKFLIKDKFVRYEDYFNSGLLLMNLNYFRNAEEIIMSGVKWRGEHIKCNAFDQDVLNYLFSKSYLKLPGKFDQFIRSERLKNEECFKIRRVIYHCTSDTLQLNSNDLFNRLWMKYFIKTPWFDEESIGRIYAGFQQLHIRFKNSMINLSAAMSGKTRVFFILKDYLNFVTENFSVHDNEEVILVDYDSTLGKLIDVMKNSRGKKIFFFMLPNFPFQALTNAGFTADEDFVNCFEFLSEVHGLPLNSYPLIQAM